MLSVAHLLPLAVSIDYVREGLIIGAYLFLRSWTTCSRTAVSDEHERSASSAKNSVSGQPGYHQQAVELNIKKTFSRRKKK